MKAYNYLRYSDDFKICYGPDSLYDEKGKIIRSYKFHPETTEIHMTDGNKFSRIETLDLSNTKVTKISDFAFENALLLKYVFLPETLEELGMKTFYNTDILDIDLSKTKLETIPEACFGSCEDLKNIKFPDTLTKIDDFAFEACYGHLNKIIIPENVKIIGESAFEGCKSLTSVVFPKNLIMIKNRAFVHTNLLEADLSNTRLLVIGRMAFYNSPIVSCTFPKCLKEIDSDIFFLTPLSKIELPFNLTKLRTILKDNKITEITYHGLNEEVIKRINKEVESVKEKKTVTFINDPIDYMLSKDASFKTINHTINKHNKNIER